MYPRLLARAATAAAVSVAVALAAPTGAHATTREFRVRLDVGSNGGAVATLVDTIMPSSQYLLTLTSAGTGTCGLTGPTVQIADFDVQGFANPVAASVAGACTLYNGSVAYTVTWTGLPGTSGQFPVQRTWVLG